VIQVYLSRRNLVTLLNKLDRNKVAGRKDSRCTILKVDTTKDQLPFKQSHPFINVTAVEDGEYYVGREATPVLPKDEPK
jgi:hypothetical protein